MISSLVASRWSLVKDLLLCLFSAGLFIFSFPNFNLWLFAWFGFVPLFFAIQGKSKTKAFLLAYLTGFIFWLGIIYWLIHVTFSGMFVLALYLALYFGIFGLIISTYNLQLTTYSFFFIPSAWVLLEYARSHLFTGFPWVLLGYSQYLNLPVVQIADITGAWGVSFLVMLVNVAIYLAISRLSLVVSEKKKYLVPILCIIVSLGYGYYRLNQRPTTNDQRPIKISVIQGDIPQELKWDSRLSNYIINKYWDISFAAAREKPDLIIWPEAALPVIVEEEPFYYERAKDLAKEINTPLLLGAVTFRDNSYYNSALLLSKEGELLTRYDKLHLVPFGEYIPLKKTLRFLETIVPIGDFTPGREYTVFNLPAKFSVLICFEDLFPEISREFIKRGAVFLVNITNDAWFKKTTAPYQHLQASVFRAVENRVFLVRSANTGVSGFIAPTGKIVSLLADKAGNNIFVPGYKSSEISISGCGLSFYSRYGDIFIAACFFFFVLYGIIALRKRP
ncbi:MAG: apolipoprotein N-acyltransferase [Candidatus Omnitrophica bacterium]|nr:apolipoprotein N-acyltransferase [Candidatus Omnitrophota bacterium]MDD5592172.1 apolipoprotein N-acyltransferase [Candidatus Omnitrophota bacterium]